MEMGREALLAKMRAGREALLAAASAAPPSGRDESGWDTADHLAHVLAWEGALVAVLTGGSTPEALGYSRDEYDRLDTDTLNAAIRERYRAAPDVLADRLGATRARLEAALAAMPDAEIEARFEAVRQWEAPGEPQWSAWDWLLSYAPAHDEEHAGYINALKEPA